MTYLSQPAYAGIFARFGKWLAVNLALYVGGAVLFGVGFLVFAALYVYFVPTPTVIPTQTPAPVQLAPKRIEPKNELPPKPADKIGPVANPQFELPVPIAKLADRDLLGKKLVNPQGVSMGYIKTINRAPDGTITFGLQEKLEASAPVIEIKVAPAR